MGTHRKESKHLLPGESYLEGFHRLTKKLLDRNTKEKAQIRRLKRRVSRLDLIRIAAHDYIEARDSERSTIQAAEKREAAFTRLRYELRAYKRATWHNIGS